MSSVTRTKDDICGLQNSQTCLTKKTTEKACNEQMNLISEESEDCVHDSGTTVVFRKSLLKTEGEGA